MLVGAERAVLGEAWGWAAAERGLDVPAALVVVDFLAAEELEDDATAVGVLAVDVLVDAGAWDGGLRPLVTDVAAFRGFSAGCLLGSFFREEGVEAVPVEGLAARAVRIGDLPVVVAEAEAGEELAKRRCGAAAEADEEASVVAAERLVGARTEAEVLGLGVARETGVGLLGLPAAAVRRRLLSSLLA